MMEKKHLKSNSTIQDSIRVDPIGYFQNKSVLSRPNTTFTSVPIKLIKYHLTRPHNSRAKFIESIQKSTIICYRCKKLKPNTFLKESQVSINKICDCSNQIHTTKILKPSEKKTKEEKPVSYQYTALFAEGKNFKSSKIRKFYSEFEKLTSESNNFSNASNYSQLKESGIKLRFLIIKGNNSGIIKEAMKRRDQWVEGFYCVTSTVNFIWQPTSTGIKFDKLKGYFPTQLLNHFENHFELSNKIFLYKNLAKFCKDNQMSVFSIVPNTFIIETTPSNFQVSLEKFKQSFFQKWESPSTHYYGHNFWILKPSSFNRGRGIHIFNSLEKLESLCEEIEKSYNYIIQKYIESPLLFNDRKFDIRMWVLVTHDNSCYYFPHGYIRTSSEPFDISSDCTNNKFIHLTNNAVQKEGSLYGKFEKGNQVSFDEFENYLNSVSKAEKFSEIMENIKDIIKVSLLAVKNKLNPRNRQYCFEIFGYDFIIDSEFKPWLIEVNTNPCLELSSPLLSQIIPRMIEDALSLTLDVLFPYSAKALIETEKVIFLPSGNLWEPVVKL